MPPPVEVALNKDNIIKAQEAILNAYRFDNPSSLTNQIKKSPFYSLMHDGISNFSAEFNGVYLKGIDSKNKPFSVPHCLTLMNGGVNVFDVANHIIDTISSCNMLGRNSAFFTINRDIREAYPNSSLPEIEPLPPSYFKLGKVCNIAKYEEDDQAEGRINEINIEIDENFPIGNTGDGVATNSKAARVDA